MAPIIIILPTVVTIDQANMVATLCILSRPGTSNHTLVILSELFNKLVEPATKMPRSTFTYYIGRTKQAFPRLHSEELEVSPDLLHQLKQLGAVGMHSSNKLQVFSPAMPPLHSS